MVADLYVGNTLADALDDTTTFVTQDDWEGTFWVLACIYKLVEDLVDRLSGTHLRECRHPASSIKGSAKVTWA